MKPISYKIYHDIEDKTWQTTKLTMLWCDWDYVEELIFEIVEDSVRTAVIFPVYWELVGEFNEAVVQSHMRA